MFGSDWDWRSVDWSYVFLLSVSPLYGFYLFCLWFFQPMLDKERDQWIMKDFFFKDPISKQSHAFPNVIEDEPTLDLSLVIPAYNEESRIHLSLEPALRYLSNRTSRLVPDPSNTKDNNNDYDDSKDESNEHIIKPDSNHSGASSKAKKSRIKEKKKNKKPFSWEIIVVCDGCRDRTAAVVRDEYVSRWSSERIRVLEYRVNEGKGYAVKQGMLHSRGKIVVFADADGASEIECLERLERDLWERLKNEEKDMMMDDDSNQDIHQNQRRNELSQSSSNGKAKCSSSPTSSSLSSSLCLFDIGDRVGGICVGSRKDLQRRAEAERSMIRNFLMWGFHFCVRFIGGVDGRIRDTQCGFKMFTRLAVRKCVFHQCIRRWCFDPEQLYLAQLQRVPVVETGIRWQEVPGSKLSLLRASINMFREMLVYRAAAVTGVWYAELFYGLNELRELVAKQRTEFGQGDITADASESSKGGSEDSAQRKGSKKRRRNKGRKA